MRIIAGQFRGRVLYSPKTKRVRPTADRVKEAWMSIVQRDIVGSRIVDLFAGSGSLGLEALSRGARSVDFVEKARACVATIQKNIAMLAVGEQCVIHVRDVVKYLTARDDEPFDLAFADPPFDSTYGLQLIEMFRADPFARILGVEHGAGMMLPGDRTTTYGDIALTFCYAS